MANDKHDSIDITQKDININVNRVSYDYSSLHNESLFLEDIIHARIREKDIPRHFKCENVFITNICNLFDNTLYLLAPDKNKESLHVRLYNCSLSAPQLREEIVIKDFDAITMNNCHVNKIFVHNTKIISIENTHIYSLYITNSSDMGYIRIQNSTIDKLYINESIIKSGILISYGTIINEISITRSIVVNNFKNKINELEELEINDITDIFIEDDLETIARDNFSLKDSLIINNNYSNVEELPDREKIIMSGDGTENNPYATRYYPNYYEQNEFLNGKYKEWNFKKYHRERNCMMCGTYYSADYNNDSEINNLREDI
jgi:hypothetical protein